MNLLTAGTLNENLGNIVTKLNELMDSFWLYIVLALAAVVVVDVYKRQVVHICLFLHLEKGCKK